MIGKIHIAILLIGLVIVILACTPTARYGVLTTLFDGVPPQSTGPELTAGIDTLGQADSARIQTLASSRRITKYEYHEPYQKKECASCHSEQYMGRLVAEEPELCYQCHDSKEQQHTVKHGPAGAGFCTACHRPHMSEADHLLLEAGSDLCFTCHNSNLIEENKIHQQLKPRDKCVDCHNPHSSENMFMLESGACYNCHEEKINDYTFLHGPVAGNYCSTCHETHTSKNKALLKLPGQKLCLNCHQETTIFMNPEHQGDGKQDCTTCHNPHGGENQFMLK